MALNSNWIEKLNNSQPSHYNFYQANQNKTNPNLGFGRGGGSDRGPNLEVNELEAAVVAVICFLVVIIWRFRGDGGVARSRRWRWF